MNRKRQIKAKADCGIISRGIADLKRNYGLLIMFLPVFLYYLIFSYKPMYGALMAFQDYSPAKGVWGSTWVGMKHFHDFFIGPYFGRLMFNTIKISLYSIVFGFPAPIILALLMNERYNSFFRRYEENVS